MVSFLGTASIVFPIPYTLLIFWLGYYGYDPLLLTISGGLGSAVGELSGYVLGYYGRKVLSEQRRRKMNYLLRLIGRYGPIAFFIFALTPLPDDLLFIPLGVLRYNLIKAFIPSFLGKLLMCYIVAYSGRVGGESILAIFGEGASWIGMIVTAALLVAALVVLYKIDWEKVFERYVGKRGGAKR